MGPKLTVTNEQIEAARVAFKEMTAAADKLHAIATELNWNELWYRQQLAEMGASDFVVMFYSMIDSCDCPGDDIIHVREFDRYLTQELDARAKA